MMSEASEPRRPGLRNREVVDDLRCDLSLCHFRTTDEEALNHHYQNHLDDGISRLSKIRVKKSPADFPDRSRTRRLRDTAMHNIKFRREARLAGIAVPNPATAALKCPVCQECVAYQESANADEEAPDIAEVFKDHVDNCLKSTPGPSTSSSNGYVEEDLVDDDFDEYTWAGQTRVRTTSLMHEVLRDTPGFTRITRGDESAELDVETDADLEHLGSAQYDESDVIPPLTESNEDRQLRLAATQGGHNKQKRLACDNDDGHSEFSHSKEGLIEEIGRLRQLALCNICMDSYKAPCVAVSCWHVHCEDCWLRALGAKKLCPQCQVIVTPKDLRRIYL